MTAATGRATRDGADLSAGRSPTSSRPAPRSGASRINDYVGRLNQPARRPRERARSCGCTRHLQSTDPERFIVACRPDPTRRTASGSSAFASAVVRERLWFLSMCFVLPGGAGRRRRPGHCSTGSARPAARTTRPRDRDRQCPADRERALRLARDRAAGPAAQPHRPAEPAGGVRGAARRASGPSRSSSDRDRTAMSASRGSSTSSITRRSAFAIPIDHRYPARGGTARLAVRGP